MKLYFLHVQMVKVNQHTVNVTVAQALTNSSLA